MKWDVETISLKFVGGGVRELYGHFTSNNNVFPHLRVDIVPVGTSLYNGTNFWSMICVFGAWVDSKHILSQNKNLITSIVSKTTINQLLSSKRTISTLIFWRKTICHMRCLKTQCLLTAWNAIMVIKNSWRQFGKTFIYCSIHLS